MNVSSAAAKHGGGGRYVDYAASKAATDIMAYGHAGYAERMIGKTPLARAAQVAEIANGVLWLLSGEASYTKGAILDVSGGMVAP